MIPGWEKCPDLVCDPPARSEIEAEYPDADADVLDRCREVVLDSGRGVTRGALYVKSRLLGSGDSFAAICALQRASSVETDSTFFSGHTYGADAMPAEQWNNYVQAAHRHGFTPPAGAKYFPNLARFQGDPEAFVTQAMGRGYIQKLIEQRGGKMNRNMEVTWNEPEGDPLDDRNCIPIAETILQREMKRASTPGMTAKSRKELRRRLISKHGPGSLK
jgi:hypothetical protein